MSAQIPEREELRVYFRKLFESVIKSDIYSINLKITQIEKITNSFQELEYNNESFFNEIKKYLIHIRDYEQSVYDEISFLKSEINNLKRELHAK